MFRKSVSERITYRIALKLEYRGYGLACITINTSENLSPRKFK